MFIGDSRALHLHHLMPSEPASDPTALENEVLCKYYSKFFSKIITVPKLLLFHPGVDGCVCVS